MRELMVVEDVLLKSTFPHLLPAGASGGPPPVCWPTQTNKQGNSGPLADEKERSLTKRCIERRWKNTLLEQNTCLGVEKLP